MGPLLALVERRDRIGTRAIWLRGWGNLLRVTWSSAPGIFDAQFSIYIFTKLDIRRRSAPAKV